MQFSLKSLLLASAVVPPAAWLTYRALLRIGGGSEFLDPVGTLGVTAWIAIYYNCVHKRLPNS